jgi:methylphosphotriester-DNA--protein-cysteine methyltransferase
MPHDVPGSHFTRKRSATVTVEVPAPLAEALVNYGDELLEALRGQREAAMHAEEARRRAEWDASRERVHVWQSRAWRYVRHNREPGETEGAACRRLHADVMLLHPHPLNHALAPRDLHTAVAARRRQVERYLDRRRAATAARLVVDGWTRQDVATVLGYRSGNSVKQLLDRHPGSLPRAQDAASARSPGTSRRRA